MKPYIRRQEAIDYLAEQGLSERVWKSLVARQIVPKVYIPPLGPGESPANRLAFYSSASVARAVENIKTEQASACTKM